MMHDSLFDAVSQLVYLWIADLRCLQRLLESAISLTEAEREARQLKILHDDSLQSKKQALTVMVQRLLQSITFCWFKNYRRRCWKQSRQYTGRPSVGLNGTSVWRPHAEHVVVNRSRDSRP